MGARWRFEALLLSVGKPRPDVSSLRTLFCDAALLLLGPDKKNKMDEAREWSRYLGPCVLGDQQGWSFETLNRSRKLRYTHEAIVFEDSFAGPKERTKRRPLCDPDDLDLAEDDDLSDELLSTSINGSGRPRPVFTIYR